jgi:hypothetical protein
MLAAYHDFIRLTGCSTSAQLVDLITSSIGCQPSADAVLLSPGQTSQVLQSILGILEDDVIPIRQSRVWDNSAVTPGFLVILSGLGLIIDCFSSCLGSCYSSSKKIPTLRSSLARLRPLQLKQAFA